jgi:hypothetical protein
LPPPPPLLLLPLLLLLLLGLATSHALGVRLQPSLAAAGLPQYVIAYFGGWSEGSTILKSAETQ